MATTLSDKVQATVAALGLTGSAWEMAPIEWVKEMRTVRGEIACPACKGRKFVTRDENGNVLEFSPREFMAEYDAQRAMEKRGDNGYCYKCGNPNKGGYPQGVVKAMVQREVTVGYVRWPEGTKFNSRFAHCDCAACGKNWITTARVPMMAKDAAGAVHGMWLGQDCASKFFEMTREAKRTIKQAAAVEG